MTRGEVLLDIAERCGIDIDGNENVMVYDQIKMAKFKKWLFEELENAEQEPCEDAVSRKAVLDMAKSYNTDGYDSYTPLVVDVEDIEELPSVTPAKCIATVKFSKEDIRELVNEKMKDIVVERKKGKWINKSHKSGCGITFIASECTCCGKKTFFNCDELIYRFCPNCGAEMEVEE